MTNLLFAAVLAATALTASPSHATTGVCDAIAGNLISNCSFETGNLSGWTVTPASAGSNIAAIFSNSYSGDKAAIFSASSSFDDSIFQVVSTIPGATYGVSMFADMFGQGAEHLLVQWNGDTLLELVSPGNAPYIGYNFSVTGTGSDTLRISARSFPGHLFVDDVAVTLVATPEPASLAILAVGLAGLAARRRRA
jgi:hypothetical protein